MPPTPDIQVDWPEIASEAYIERTPKGRFIKFYDASDHLCIVRLSSIRAVTLWERTQHNEETGISEHKFYLSIIAGRSYDIDCGYPGNLAFELQNKLSFWLEQE